LPGPFWDDEAETENAYAIRYAKWRGSSHYNGLFRRIALARFDRVQHFAAPFERLRMVLVILRDFRVQVPAIVIEAEAGVEGLGVEFAIVTHIAVFALLVVAQLANNVPAFHGFSFQPHLESFGGCMLGQLCPPSLLIAMSVLECLFFRQHGVRSVSLSYAQQTSPDQDREAVLALRRLAAELLPDMDWHVVIYAYMGVYPRTTGGASALLAEAARLAVRTGAPRLIVKTTAEAHRIPTIADNVNALETAAAAAADERRQPMADPVSDTGIYAEARALVSAVLDLRPDIGRALADAFRLGYLDVPYCLHPDNAGRARARIDGSGRLNWSDIGSMPIRDVVGPRTAVELTSTELLASLLSI